jgi:hypothetical protein
LKPFEVYCKMKCKIIQNVCGIKNAAAKWLELQTNILLSFLIVKNKTEIFNGV